MTAWSESERADLRAYIGSSSLFRQFEPRWENAITSVQSVADGGSLPTSDTQTRMRTVLTQLKYIDSKLIDTQTWAQALEVDKGDIKVDYIRANFLLKMEGRRLITQLCTPLGLKGPFKDYYSGLSVEENYSGNPFVGNW
jgi:hypothetical protein